MYSIHTVNFIYCLVNGEYSYQLNLSQGLLWLSAVLGCQKKQKKIKSLSSRLFSAE